MLSRFAIALMLSLPLPAFAESPPDFARYWANSGSLPPEYAWDVEVTISPEGRLVLKRCTGYETEGPACKIRKARVGAAALDAIRAAAIKADLLASPARTAEDIPIGGGSAGGSVTLDAETLALPAWPVADDVERVGTVLKAIRAAIPARFDRFLDGE